MKTSRRPLFWLVVVLSAALATWWTLHVPYAPERLYRAIPAKATVVSAHYDLAGRWDALSVNPVTASFFGAMGIDSASLKSLGTNDEFRVWLSKLASDEMVIAYVPSLGITGDAGWVFSTWLGGRSQRLRWSLMWGKVPGLQKITSHTGWPVWVTHSALLKKGEFITLSLVEGMLVGCIANNMSCIDEVLRSLNGNYPSLAARSDLMLAPETDGRTWDRGWVKMGSGPVTGVYPESRVHYKFTDVKPASIEGAVKLPFPCELDGTAAPDRSMDGLTRVIGDAPLGFILFDKSIDTDLLELALLPEAWTDTTTDLMARAEGTMAICLLGGDYRGRFKGVRLPTLLLGTAVQDTSNAMQAVAQHLDQLNADFQWGLVPQESSVGPYRVVAVEGTSENLYSSVAMSERIAYAAADDWFLLSSNLEGLTNLLAKAVDRTQPSDTQLSHGLMLRDMNRAPIYGWVDLAEGGKAIRLAITAWSLKLSFEDPFGSQSTRQRLNETKAWIEALAPLTALQFWLRPAGESTEIQFKAGKQITALQGGDS